MILPHLPRESGFKRAIDPDGAAWGRGEYIAADIFDVLAAANWQRANQGSENPSERPKPYPRPGDQVQESTAAESKIAFLKAQAERARAAKEGE